MGDRHVYGAKSRFLTRAVMACLDQHTWGEADSDGVRSQGRADVDVAAKLRGLWA